jgi:lysophospholipase L1-like esterase
MVVWLLLFDRAVPPLLELAERRHYESTTTFRFENSDLFALGPLVDYLREHPRHERRRIVFFGNSMIFGYFLTPAQAIPAQFQKLQPEARVYNAAVNGQEMGTSDFVGKAILDSVDVMYVQVIRNKRNEIPSVIPIDDADLRRFHLTPPTGVEARLQAWLGRVWRAYGLNYRMQAALFGTSTRVFLYMHKRELARALHVRTLQPAPDSWKPIAGHISLRAPRAAAVQALPRSIETDLAELARSRGKRIVFIDFEWRNSRLDEAEIAAFNAAYAPFAENVIITVPPEVTIDGQHPVPAAAAQIAEALARHEAQR